MARIRSIKPEFWTSEKVVECSPSARLLFVGMWNFCDDRGVHPDSAKRLKMEVFPGDDLSSEKVSGLIDELLAVGLLLRFTAEGKQFLVVTGWHHQKIDRPQPRYPEPPSQDEIRRILAERSSNDRRLLSEQSPLEWSGREGKGEERKGEEGSGVDPTMSGKPDVAAVFAHYRTYHPKSHPSPKSTGKEWKAIAARLREGYTVADLCQAIDGIHKSPHHCGQNDRGTKYQSLELCMRSGDHVAGFIEHATTRAGPVLSVKSQRTQSAIDQFVSEREGNHG